MPTVPEARRGGSSPGWPEVLLVAALVVGAVLAVEVLSAVLPPVREAFRGFPVTIVVLVVGTVGLLLLIGFRRPRP
jgi:hypothetical protein